MMIDCTRDCLNCPYPEMPEECEELEPTPWELGVMSSVEKGLKKARKARRAKQIDDRHAKAQAHIAQARKARCMSQTALAAAVGCNLWTIWSWENGRNKANWDKLLPTLPELKAVYEDVAKYEAQCEEDRAGEQAWIARVRKERGITQKDLAAAIGRAPGTVCSWEKGHRQADWDRLCKALPELGKYRPKEETEQCGRY